MTLPVLNSARAVAFLVSGRNKAEAVRSILERNPDVDEMPAAGVAPQKGTVEWLVDAPAASLL